MHTTPLPAKMQPLKKVLGKIDPGFVLIIALPLILIAINRLWIFPPNGWIDSWYYFGYFIRLEQYLNSEYHPIFPKEIFYLDSRLPWTVPGWLSYRIFPPIVANYVLHLTFYYGTIVSVYLALKHAIGARTGLITSILMGSYGYLMIAYGWEYVEGPCITYYCMTVAGLTLSATQDRWRQGLVVAGAAFAALIYTNTVWLIHWPGLFLFYVWLNYTRRKNPLLQSILVATASFLGLTLILCIFNYVVAGRFWFFLPALKYSMGGRQYYPFWAATWSVSLKEHQWLWLPTTVFCTSLLTILFRLLRLKSFQLVRSPYFSGLAVLFIVAMGVLEWQGFGTLRTLYYGSYLIPTTFLALGEQIAPVLESLKRRHFQWLLAGVFVLQILYYQQMERALLFGLGSLSLTELPFQIAFAVTGLLLVLVLAKFLLPVKRVRQVLTLNLILVVALFGFNYAANFPGLMYLGIKSDWRSTCVKGERTNPPCLNPVPEDIIQAVIQVQTILSKLDPKVEMLYWFNQEESMVFASIGWSGMPNDHLVSAWFPNFNFLDKGDLAPDAQKARLAQVVSQFNQQPKIVLLSRQPDVVQQANQALATLGFTGREVNHYDISQGDIQFRMTIIEVLKLPG